MKKTLLLVIIALTTIMSFAQTQPSNHLLFKGVPIDGTLSEYVLKMKHNGFSLKGMEDGIAILKGDFAAYKDCTIAVATLKQKDLVSKISVVFPDVDTWSLLSSNYFRVITFQ